MEKTLDQPINGSEASRFERPEFSPLVWNDLLPGLRIVSSHYMADRVQFRFPRSKKRRIRRKWAKRPENYKTVPWDKAWLIGGTVYMHPIMVEKLKREIDRRNRDRAVFMPC